LVREVIRPNLEAGKVVLCDRYADATLAYQGYGHETDLLELRRVVEYATGGLKPDLTLYLDIDVEKGLRRKGKGEEWNRLDAYEVEFHERARAGYHELIAQEPERWVVIDAGQSVKRVQEDLKRVVLERLGAGE